VFVRDTLYGRTNRPLGADGKPPSAKIVSPRSNTRSILALTLRPASVV
jgi:hypothetical protein